MKGLAPRSLVSLGCVLLLGVVAAVASAAPGGSRACVAAKTATTSTALPSPTFAVDPFNRTRNLNDLYVARPGFPGGGERAGRLEKLRLRSDGVIIDGSGSPAVDVTTGSVRPDARGLWLDPTADDGGAGRMGANARARAGGWTAPLYTDLRLGALALGGNTVEVANTRLTPRLLGLAAGDTAGRVRLITAALGAEGGPVGRAQPVTVVYGGAPARPAIADAAVLVATDDGRLHAFDALTGRELWSFVPLEVLSRPSALHPGPRVTAIAGGLGGNIRLYRDQVSGGGSIDRAAGDRVYLVYGSGRGGSAYYGFDITSKTSPVLLWRDGSAELPSVGESWSTPAIARIRIAGTQQNSQHLVAIVGGGDDPVGGHGKPHVAQRGNAIYMLDLLSGELLWHAGPGSARGAGRSADLRLDRMTEAIPADVRVLDLMGDGYVHRMYAVDTGGRIWRFDIHNGQPPASLVTGGVFASLGAADEPHSATDARGFYHAPDVALLHDHGSLFVQLSVGSGLGGALGAGGTTESRVQHYFYGVRDYDLGPLPQASYGPGGWNASRVLTNRSRFVDATMNPAPTLPPGSAGWRIALGKAEAVLGEARTFGAEVFFTTFTPGIPGKACAAVRGEGRLYVLNARNGGRPGNRAAKYMDLPATSLAATVEFAFPSPDGFASRVGSAGPGCTEGGAACRPDPVCLVGLTSCGALPVVAPVRTTWSQRGVAD
ncbi:MAG TPA: PQQ-binding-like beta-propeller repeat protein [Steroidobacteraceae bacterium]|nr:PQQ-binding-like beta-propeller repeat protein [Steroidobacteraceae bacterium]